MGAIEDELWVSQATAARAVKMQPPNFIDQLRPHLPPDAVKNKGSRVLVYLPALVETYAARRVASAGAGIDPDMAGADSPALEKFRLMRAGQEEIKLQKMRGEVVFVSELKTGLQQVFAPLRRGIERLQRERGNEAADLVLEPLADVERNLERVVTTNPADVSPVGGAVAGPVSDDSAAASADDAGVRGVGDCATDRPVQGVAVQGEPKPVRGPAVRGDGKRKMAKSVRHRAKPKR